MEHAAHRRQRRAAQLLALIAVALAAMCAGLAFAWRQEHERAECWRGLVEDEEIPPEGRCA